MFKRRFTPSYTYTNRPYHTNLPSHKRADGKFDFIPGKRGDCKEYTLSGELKNTLNQVYKKYEGKLNTILENLTANKCGSKNRLLENIKKNSRLKKIIIYGAIVSTLGSTVKIGYDYLKIMETLKKIDEINKLILELNQYLSKLEPEEKKAISNYITRENFIPGEEKNGPEEQTESAPAQNPDDILESKPGQPSRKREPNSDFDDKINDLNENHDIALKQIEDIINNESLKNKKRILENIVIHLGINIKSLEKNLENETDAEKIYILQEKIKKVEELLKACGNHGQNKIDTAIKSSPRVTNIKEEAPFVESKQTPIQLQTSEQPEPSSIVNSLIQKYKIALNNRYNLPTDASQTEIDMLNDKLDSVEDQLISSYEGANEESRAEIIRILHPDIDVSNYYKSMAKMNSYENVYRMILSKSSFYNNYDNGELSADKMNKIVEYLNKINSEAGYSFLASMERYVDYFSEPEIINNMASMINTLDNKYQGHIIVKVLGHEHKHNMLTELKEGNITPELQEWINNTSWIDDEVKSNIAGFLKIYMHSEILPMCKNLFGPGNIEPIPVLDPEAETLEKQYNQEGIDLARKELAKIDFKNIDGSKSRFKQAIKVYQEHVKKVSIAGSN